MPSSDGVSGLLHQIVVNSDGRAQSDPILKVYPDAAYFNYYDLGITLLFSPREGYRPQSGTDLEDLDVGRLHLESLDVYNDLDNGKTSNQQFSPYPALPISFKSMGEEEKVALDVFSTTTGADFVSFFGEPTRKGGGGGPSGGSIGVWCEWKTAGLMVEFGGEKAKSWETGKDAVWAVMTIFEPKLPGS